MQSTYVAEECILMQIELEKGNIEVEDIYVQIVRRMLTFLEKLRDLSKSISKIN